ncbi:MAG: nonstructural protein [Microvirus sp.]|nr:MAG: nonstructural protein [Microvirus sp.]
MTILQCVTIRDAKVAFNQPFFVPTLAHAIRAFSDEANRPDATNFVNKHPNDYSLWHLGTYNDEDASFSLLPIPTNLIEAAQCLNAHTSLNSKTSAHQFQS